MQYELLETISNTLSNAKVHYRLWEEMMKRRDARSVEIVNSGYGTFIEYTRHAHFKTFIVDLHKLIERRTDTHNLGNLFKAVKADEGFTDELSAEIEMYLSETEGNRKSLFILRNEVEAHSTKKRSPEDSYKAASISSQQIDDFIRATALLLNVIGSHFFQKTWAYNEISEADNVQRLYEAMALRVAT